MLGNWASSAPQIQVSPTLASPALAVKAGRERGLSVMARKQKAEAEQIAAEGGIAQREYVSELDGSGDGARVVGDKVLGGAPRGSVCGVIYGSPPDLTLD